MFQEPPGTWRLHIYSVYYEGGHIADLHRRTRALEKVESLCMHLVCTCVRGSARTLGGWSYRELSTCVPLSNQTDPAWVQVARFLSLYRMFSRISAPTGKEFCPRIVFPDVYTSREYENVGWSVFSKIGERDGDKREGNRFEIILFCPSFNSSLLLLIYIWK